MRDTHKKDSIKLEPAFDLGGLSHFALRHQSPTEPFLLYADDLIS